MKKATILKTRFILILILITISFQKPLNLEARDEITVLKKVEVSGTIRNTKQEGWFVINDVTHESINIKSVKESNGVVVIEFPFIASKIHTFIASPDDSLAFNGYFIGSSVTTKSASILISKISNGKIKQIDADDLNEPYNNIWIYGLFSIEEKKRSKSLATR